MRQQTLQRVTAGLISDTSLYTLNPRQDLSADLCFVSKRCLAGCQVKRVEV